MPASTDKLQMVGIATATTLDAPGYTIGGTSLTVASTANMPTATGITVAVDVVDSDGVQVPGSYNEYVGVVTSATAITSLSHANGTDRNYAAGATTRVYLPVSAERENRIVEWGTAEHNQDGTHSDITADSIVATGDIEAASFTLTGAGGAAGWEVGLPAPDTVTNNGNRSYDLVFNSTDLTDTVSEGMRLRTTRTVSAPTQCADLEASSSQYFSDASAGLTGMTFTDDFAVSAWVKLESYGSVNPIAGRWNGTSGWMFYINEAGAIILNGSNGAAANYSRITSYQSVPLNKWVYIAAQLDMSAFTATTTTSYIMIDGVNVPAVVARGGTNPVALVQAGDLNIGAYNSGSQLFDGKLAQVAVFGTKVTQATMITYMSQGLLGSEANLVCAYSLSNDITDLSANNNDLTANGGALATDVDSPFGSYLGATLDYGIITKTAFSTDTTLTVQVPEGCTIPTSGGVSAVSYSTQAVPYLFPRDGGRWELESIIKTSIATASNTNWGAFSSNGWALNVPVGGWTLGFTALLNSSVTTRISWSISPTALSGALGTEDSRWTTAIRASAAASTDFPVSISNGISISSSQNWVMYTLGATTSGNVLGSLGLSVIKAIPAYL